MDTESKHSHRLQWLLACNEALIQSISEQEWLESFCGIAVNNGSYRGAWIGYIEAERSSGIRRRACAAAGIGDDRGSGLETLELIPSELLVGQVQIGGSAARVLIDAVGEVICLPLKQAHGFGLLLLDAGPDTCLQEEELIWLQQVSALLAFGIHNLRAGSKRQRIHDAVLAMARGVSASTGEEFFLRLVLSAVEALGADSGYIVRLNGSATRARTLCAVVSGKPVANFEYSVAGTPCEQLVKSGTRVFPEKVAVLYTNARYLAKRNLEAYVGARLKDASGKLVGLMFVLFSEPRPRQDFVSSALGFFAGRAAGELERQKSDALVREQAALLDKAQDAILVHDFEYRVGFWNSSAERLYGWSADEAIGCLANQLIYQNPAALASAMETTLAKGEWVGELVHTSKEGEPLTVEARWTLVRDEKGEPKSVLSINTDITGRKKLEEQFLRAQRMESIGTLAGGIAHDINNVLSPILMSIDLLRMYVDHPDGVNILDMVGASARRGAEMVRQVLSFARGVEGKVEEVEVTQIIEDLVRIIEETFPKNIRLETRLQTDLWVIKADSTQIHQVLLNLCVNARDAMPDGGLITLKVQNMLIDERHPAANFDARPGPYLTIEIADTGHGIPPDIIEKIYDPFFTTKEHGKGTGLGLSTTLAIMKSHCGFITTSSDPGSGARFRLHLPAMTQPGWVAAESPSTKLPRGRGETILVVDDEVYVRQITSQTLEAFGYKVMLAANGSEAVSMYVEHQGQIALVLTDMMMPVMDGHALIRSLRHLNPFVKIIAASGFTSRGRIPVGTGAGANDFLPKPYSAETLLKSIRRLLRETQA